MGFENDGKPLIQIDYTELKDQLQGVSEQLAKIVNQGGGSYVVDLAKYGITATTTDLTATTENYHIAYANGVGFQNAINDAKAKGIKEVTIPAGNYPLCYHSESDSTYHPIIDSRGIDIIAYGCRFYVVFDDLNTGLNPYYTGDPTKYYLLAGYIFLTDSSIKGCEIVGERAQRTHANTKYRDDSIGIALDNYTNGNVIKDCRIHHVSGDGIAQYRGMEQFSGWPGTVCTALTWDGTAWVASNYAYRSPRHSIYWADIKKPIQMRSANYFIWTTEPIKIHCFTSTESYIGTVKVNQGEPFFFLEGSYYWYLEVTYSGSHGTTSTSTLDYWLGYGYYHNTTIENCEVFLNQRGGISNIPSSSVIKDCSIHHNGGAYGTMPAYYDNTQFGIDMEDWFAHRITVNNCLIYSNMQGVLYRCYSMNIIDCIIDGNVKSMNFAVDFYAKGTLFKGSCTMVTPASFGKKTAVNCVFSRTKAAEIVDLDTISDLNHQVKAIKVLTQAEYDALGTEKNTNNTLYLISR